MHIIKSVLVLLFLLPAYNTIAQTAARIHGSVQDKNLNVVPGATVSLLRATDSTVIKLSASDKEGKFVFDEVTNGKYVVSVTAVGYRKSYSNMMEASAHQQEIGLPAIIINPVSKEIGGVTVTARRPLVEQRIDRTIVNVDASIMNLGTSALEVLEKSPGVTVDRDGNISLKGKEGVLIMVDGRPTQLGGADLANLLRTMSSNQLDQIEIMTNPPARYDAAGTSGIINIKTKKIITAGLNGSGSVTYSQGRYPKTAESFNFNYRKRKVNLFANVSHNYQKRFLTLNIDRNIYNSNTNGIDNIFRQENNKIMEANSYNIKAGIDFFANKKTTLGTFVTINSRPASITNPTLTNIFNASHNLESITTAMLTNETDWNSFNGNLNFRHLLNAKGRELTADIDVAKYGMANEQFMINAYADAIGNPYKKTDTLMAQLPQNLQVYSARADYLQPLKKDGRFEAGIKTSIVQTDNNARYDSIVYGSIVHDFNRSNHFTYEETINAAYVNLSTALSKKITAQFGLRLENTNTKGKQKTTGENFQRNYTQLFPTAYFQYKINDNNNLGLNFGRRVRRPGYQTLNPFVRFIDRYTYSQGNPALKPAISNNIEISYTWKDQITTTLNYTHTKDIISEITEQKGEEAYNMFANVGTLNQFGIAVSANTPVTKWWTSIVNINTYTDHYKGMVSNAAIKVSGTSFIINGTQQFKINKTLTAELNGMYRNGGLEGLIRVKHVGYIGAGISKKVLKNQGTLRLSARDIFHTQKLKGASQYNNVDFQICQVSDTQVISIGFSYAFSKGKKNAPVKRTDGSAGEEQGRIGQ